MAGVWYAVRVCWQDSNTYCHSEHYAVRARTAADAVVQVETMDASKRVVEVWPIGSPADLSAELDEPRVIPMAVGRLG